MKKLIGTAAMVAALAVAGTAAAALIPGTFVGPGAVCSPTSTFSGGGLHVSKPCTTPTNASAGGAVTRGSGQTFASAAVTPPNTKACHGGPARVQVRATRPATS